MPSPNIEKFMLSILAIMIIIIFAGCIYALFFAIYQFVFSGWDAEKIKSAWNSIRYMIIGVVLTFIFLFLFPLIFKKLKVQGYEMYTAQNIFLTAGNIIFWMFNFAGEAIDIYQSAEDTSWNTWVIETKQAPTSSDFEL